MRGFQSLLGPRRWIERVLSDLDDGLSCVVILPKAKALDLADLVLSEIVGAVDVIDVEPPQPWSPPKSVVDGVVHTVGESGWDPGLDLLAALIRWDALAARTIVVRSWSSALTGVDRFVGRLPATLHDQGAAPGDRVRFLVLARLCDLDANAVDHVDGLTVRTHWWWGCVGSLDTAIHAAARGSSHDRVALETCIEVAGWDLDVVDYLLDRWDGSPSSLSAVVRAYPEQAGQWGVDLARSVALPVPTRDVRDGWDRGVVDRWGDDVRRSARDGLSDKELEGLVWRAQNRALMPLIDDLRQHFESLVRARATPEALREISRDPDSNAILEVGQMKWAVDTGLVRLPKGEREVLRRVTRARNALAHRRCLTAGEVRELLKVWPAAH